MQNINKKEYAALCYPDSEYMQKFIESKTFAVVPLDDGFASVEKSTIEKDFCFGAGMNASATAENRIKYRLATRAELAALLDAEKKQLADFEKRLARWWKRYGADKINAWFYIRD